MRFADKAVFAAYDTPRRVTEFIKAGGLMQYSVVGSHSRLEKGRTVKYKSGDILTVTNRELQLFPGKFIPRPDLDFEDDGGDEHVTSHTEQETQENEPAQKKRGGRTSLSTEVVQPIGEDTE